MRFHRRRRPPPRHSDPRCVKSRDEWPTGAGPNSHLRPRHAPRNDACARAIRQGLKRNIIQGGVGIRYRASRIMLASGPCGCARNTGPRGLNAHSGSSYGSEMMLARICVDLTIQSAKRAVSRSPRR
jgi:hypothetical protein